METLPLRHSHPPRYDSQPMKTRHPLIALAMVGASFMFTHGITPSPAAAQKPDEPRKYPAAPTGDVVDEYHGVKVPDPYRPLEDPDSPETRAWVEAENKITFGYLEKIPAREALRKRLTELWDYEKFGAPSKEGPRYILSRNSGLQNHSVLYTADALDADMKVLIDPNKLSENGTVALSGGEFSQDGSLFAYGLAADGSDWTEWKVRDVASGKDRDDLLK